MKSLNFRALAMSWGPSKCLRAFLLLVLGEKQRLSRDMEGEQIIEDVLADGLQIPEIDMLLL